MSLLELEDVHVRYGGIEAVKGISFEVDEGELVTLIGGNGAGKTTTLKTISGLKRPSEGTILFEGRPIESIPAHEIVDMGVCQAPEGRRIFPRMTVHENLEMGAYGRKDHSSVKEDYERVYTLFPVLRERQKQKGGTLSGGEQQMLAIGRALMGRPRLLMLDEPSMGLAPLVVEKIFGLLREIHDQGTTILLVEQNAQAALRLADRGYVIESGEIVLTDEAKALLGNEQVRKAYLGVE
ncbi:MAG: branched-chain amino acid transport system ATP-binding protein [Actinomycetota bacterium]|jgi:branched-chain amino acid transport system ATP-binding protein|nr:branched-chain amino acid transport system ATP-binding protein [Actinomycetota bacterium]